ncbi:MAG TPA: glycosyltransferase [Chitinophagaceae bacterium]|nr:glycosyltransferase [Chitinophagaceae bacterium]
MSNIKKTIVILTPGFPEDENDTTCLPLHQSFVQTLKEMFPEINTIVLALQYPYKKRQYSWWNTEVISFNGRNKRGLFKYILRQKLYKTLNSINKHSDKTVLLSLWYGESALIAKKYADKNHIKHFCWLQGQDAKKNNPFPMKVKLTSDKIIALSDFLQDEFEKNHGTKPQHVIPPGIDTRKFSEAVPDKSIDILGAGSLISLKQYDSFLNIVAEIKKVFPELKVMLIGSGPEKDNLEKLIRELKLEKNVTLTGELSYGEVLKKMQQAKVFLHTSCYEGFGMVCQEALYAGARVISFNRPLKTSIRNWDIVNSDEEMMSRALEILLDYQNTFEKVLPFTIEETTSKMVKLFFE